MGKLVNLAKFILNLNKNNNKNKLNNEKLNLHNFFLLGIQKMQIKYD